MYYASNTAHPDLVGDQMVSEIKVECYNKKIATMPRVSAMRLKTFSFINFVGLCGNFTTGTLRILWCITPEFYNWERLLHDVFLFRQCLLITKS